jgi:site-specific DNA-methyltransferase (adenine-specific)
MAALSTGWILVFCQIEAAMLWRVQLEEAGAIYRRSCIWVKPDGMPQYSGDRPGMGYETFVACHAPGRSKWNGGGKHGVFTFNKGENGGIANEHETQKPLKLIKELASLFSNPGETILDPFMGSGTTLRAAKDLGRKCIGIEIEEKYCEIAVRRLAQGVLKL